MLCAADNVFRVFSVLSCYPALCRWNSIPAKAFRELHWQMYFHKPLERNRICCLSG